MYHYDDQYSMKRPRPDEFSQGMGPRPGAYDHHPQYMQGVGDPYQRGMPGAAMGLPGRGYERVFSCAKLRGLPFHTTEEEIRGFLGTDPIDILLCRSNGRVTGEAFVVFATYGELEIAMSRNKTYMGQRYVEVFQARKIDYYQAVYSEVADTRGRGGRHPEVTREGGHHHGGGGGGPRRDYVRDDPDAPFDITTPNVLKLRGLPFTAGAEDVSDWFNTDSSLGIQPIAAEAVYLPQEGGRPTGVAFVAFATTDDATAARGKHRQMLGTRYVEIFPVDRR